jgi:type II secretory pathway component HofQ
VNSSFIGVGISASGQPALGNAVPSFQYEDLGLTLKSTPHYHLGNEVTLDMELTIKNLGATQANGLPLIIAREYKGNITIRDNEAAMVTGYITVLQTSSGQGLVARYPSSRTLILRNACARKSWSWLRPTSWAGHFAKPEAMRFG